MKSQLRRRLWKAAPELGLHYFLWRINATVRGERILNIIYRVHLQLDDIEWNYTHNSRPSRSRPDPHLISDSPIWHTGIITGVVLLKIKMKQRNYKMSRRHSNKDDSCACCHVYDMHSELFMTTIITLQGFHLNPCPADNVVVCWSYSKFITIHPKLKKPCTTRVPAVKHVDPDQRPGISVRSGSTIHVF